MKTRNSGDSTGRDMAEEVLMFDDEILDDMPIRPSDSSRHAIEDELDDMDMPPKPQELLWDECVRCQGV